MRRPLPLGRRLVFGVAAATLPLLGGELVCRVREDVESSYAPLQPDTSCGVALAPRVRFVRDGRVAEINALGMREREVGPKRPGVTRILCVGGSSTYGLFVGGNRWTWPAQLERRLLASGLEVEVLNAGCPSWTLRSSQTKLDMALYDLEPDIIIVCHLFNDLMACPGGGVTARSGTYVPDSFVEDSRDLWTPHRASALVRAVARRVMSFGGPQRKASTLPDSWQQAFGRNLERMIQRGQQRGARVLVLTEPSCLRETPEASLAAGVPGFDSWHRFYCTVEWDVLLAGVERFRAETLATCLRLGAPFVDLEPTLPDAPWFWRSPMHRSEVGEALVAERVARELGQQGWLAR